MKQSQLNFKENTKDCVWCTFDGFFEFYWEPRYDRICVTDMRNANALCSDIFISTDLKAPAVRKEICDYLKGVFNV